MVYNLLSKDKPCMIARYGAVEISCILNFLSINNPDKNIWKYIKGDTTDWWWNRNIMQCMETNAGFFPTTEGNLKKFTLLMLKDSGLLDMLAVFSNTIEGAVKLRSYMPANIPFTSLASLDSFIQKKPWTRVLAGKNVLVVHPFAELIKKQYVNRELLFNNNDVLPEFNLRTLKAVQSIGGVGHGFADWFEALEWMKKEMEKEPYDIALIGCGAYGFPLAAHSKRTGHKSVHIGGSLQLLFGIKGNRWENPNYATQFGLPPDTYMSKMNNPAWVRPSEYRTKESERVENACYW